MKQWKKYLPGAVLIITFVCILFFIAINRHKDISGNTDSRVSLQKKEMPALLKSRQGKFYTGENIEDPAAKVITRNEMLSSIFFNTGNSFSLFADVKICEKAIS